MKKIVSMILSLCMAASLAACGAASSSQSSRSSTSESSTPESDSRYANSAVEREKHTFRIAGMKGPTTMGMLQLMDEAEQGHPYDDYQTSVYATAQEILPLLIQGEVDVALLPANVASTVYNQTQGKIQVAAINTLGVLYVVENGDSIQSIADLKGKTIYSTGKGNTPEYTLNYILSQNGIDPTTNVTIEYNSEATEVAAMLAQDSGDAIAVLPQPYVTTVMAQNENLRVALDLTEEWDKVNPDSTLVTGVLVANKEFIENDPEAFDIFMGFYELSIEYVNEHPAEAAEWMVKYGILPNATIAEKALPECNITYIDAAEMKDTLSGYLQVLMDQNPASIGGAMPADDFYYYVAE